MVYEFNDEFINEYSKKIFRFAYTKTGDVYNAEDLSQEIIISLADSLGKSKDIVNFDGYVWTICYYTWSKYLKRNKKHWQGIDINEVQDLQSEDCIESKAIQNEEILMLQRYISYLSKQHRQITIMFYFENQTCEKIAQKLGISNGAVRWHLYEIRKKLKEGIEMSPENLSYTPKRLMVGLDGNLGSKGQAGLDRNLLCQNIVITCYGEPLSIEEIARKLSVAAAYLEYHINDLLYLDYLKVIDKNKYQTNFFIRELKHEVLTAKYHYENIGNIAVKIYNEFNKRYNNIKNIGFTGSDLDRDYVLWSLIPLYTGSAYWDVYGEMLSRNSANCPKRKDGSQHWVRATLADDDYFKNNSVPQEMADFWKKSKGTGIKTNNSKLNVHSLQLDSYVTIKLGIHWRQFGDSELNELFRIKQLIDTGENPNENDKLIISKMVDLGYVYVKDEKPKILVPFFDKTQYKMLQDILEEIKKDLGKNLFSEYINNYAVMFEKHIPGFISKAERYYVSHNIYPQYAVLYYLADSGYIRYPSEEEAKRICTVLWCE